MLFAPASCPRLIVKIGSALLVDEGGAVRRDWLAGIAADIAARCRAGQQVAVVSSGAIALGARRLGLAKGGRASLEDAQAAAATGQIALSQVWAEVLGAEGLTAAQILVTLDDLEHRRRYLNAAATLDRLLTLGVVPIINENDSVATEEIRFGDNDRLAALVAHLVHADLLVLLSDVDGLYTGHPSLPESRPITDVHGPDDLDDVDVARVGSKVGTGGMVTKVEAARIATGAGIPVVLARADHARAAVLGEQVGTRFHPTGRRRPTRLLWLEHASETKGRLLVDDGAVRALTVRKASLLAAGIVGVEGEFGAGEPVDVVAPDGTVVARGLVTYDSAELPTLLGRSTPDLAADLGADYEREVVHRDDLVVLHPH